jgi:peptidyl-prolyl cis-trans isomerase D
MFEFVRKHTKIMMFFMFLLLIPAFVLVGIDGFMGKSGGGQTVAQVGGHAITQAQWDAAHQNQIQRLRASSPNIDPQLLDSASVRYASLERLIRQQVITAAAQDMHLVVSDERLRKLFRDSPEFDTLRREDGTLDVERYTQIATSQGLSMKQLDLRISQQIAERTLESGILTTAFAAPEQAKIAFNAFFERRDVQLVQFSPAEFAAKVNPTDAEIDAYYKSHQAAFEAPEVADVEYVVLDMDAVKKSLVLKEQDLKTYYDANVERLSGKEERRASHILINAAKSLPSAERQKAKEQAQKLLEQIRKNPANFAEFAKNNSQDPGSAKNGGDLNFFGRGTMVKPFEDAAFSLKKNEISEVVESDFGYHIIQLTDVKLPKQKSFEELRITIESDVRAQQAQVKFAEVAEAFSEAVYSQPQDLQNTAKKLNLELKTASNILSKPKLQDASILGNAKLLAEIFSSESIKSKNNTQAIETAPNQLVSARITRYKAAQLQPLAEVSANVRERLVASRSIELAKTQALEKLEAWKKKEDASVLGPMLTLSRDQANKGQERIINEVLRAPTTKLPAWVAVDLGKQGYAVVRINKVVPRAQVDEATAKQELAQYTQLLATAENQAFYEQLKKRYKVKIKVPKPAAEFAGADLSTE